jgi:hypothetical protein
MTQITYKPTKRNTIYYFFLIHLLYLKRKPDWIRVRKGAKNNSPQKSRLKDVFDGKRKGWAK